jgi:Cof subfamily protein (haloacid dehalogenase superfamily)
MGKFSGMLLCCDIDDTLMTTDKKITPSTAGAIAYFQSEGGKFTLASGRGLRGVELCLDYVKPDLPAICDNGAALYDLIEKRYIKTIPLDEGAHRLTYEVLRRFPTTCAEIYNRGDTIFDSVNALALRHMKNERLPDIRCRVEDISVEWLKVVFVDEPDTTTRLRAFLEDGYSSLGYHFVQSTRNYYEILPGGASKGAMLRTLAEYAGIELCSVAAVGDNENDIEMIEAAGFGAAMGNGVGELKRRAKFTVASNNDDGVAQFVSLLGELRGEN